MSEVDKAESLLRLLTLDEKIALLHQHQPAVPRLGLQPLRSGCEVLHGVVSSTPCTVFPQAIGLGATWNPDLLHRIGDAIAQDIEYLLAQDTLDPVVGRNVWSPVVNLLRDPRWGRNEEGYSEDPHLTVELACGFCAGLAGDGRTRRIAPTLKSFLAYNHETDKFATSIDLRPRVLREYDLPPFLGPLRRGVAAAVMPSYIIVNGRPNHLSQHLRTLREAAPDVVVFSDGFAPSDLIEKAHYYDDREHAYPAAMRAGLDSFTDHWSDPTITAAALDRAVALGVLAEEDVDVAVRRLLLLRARLGEFDVEASPSQDAANSPEHRSLAREAVREAVVLLRNEALLPFSPAGERTIAVIGPMTDRCCRDWYSGPLPYRITPLDGIRAQAHGDVVHAPGLDHIALRAQDTGRYLAVDEDGTVRAEATVRTEASCFEVFDWGEGGISLRSLRTGRFLSGGQNGSLRCDVTDIFAWQVKQTFGLERQPDGRSWLLRNAHYGGCVTVHGSDVRLVTTAGATLLDVETVSQGTETAAAAARTADCAIVVVGTHPQINGAEGRDRQELGLPPTQEQLVTAVLAANPRTAVVLVSGHPLAVPALADTAPAILWSSHGGQELGNGLADVLFGGYSPAGRLPQSWPRSAADLAGIHDYDIIKNRQTYLYSDREPLFAFGHGLGYTTFDYGPPLLSTASAAPDDTVAVSVDVTNTGTVDSDEVAQLYVRALDAPVPRPLRQLHGFRRVHIPAGGTARLEFPLAVKDLAFWDVGRGQFAVAPGRYAVMAGPSSTTANASAVLTVAASPLPPRDLSSALVRAVDFDDYHAVRIIDEARRSGEAVKAERAGAWLLFRDVLVPSGTDGAVLRVGVADQCDCRIEIRVDDPFTGPLIGAVQVPPEASGRYEWRTVSTVPNTAAQDVHGRRDVYFVFSRPARLATFALTAAQLSTGAASEH